MLDINYLSPYIRVAMDSAIESQWHLKERVIFDYELLFVKNGEISVTIEDEIYNGKPGDIFLFKPKQRHSFKVISKNDLHQPHIHFDLFYEKDSPDVKVSFKSLKAMSENELSQFREDVTQYPNLNLPNKIILKNTKYFEELLFDIIKEFEAKLPCYEIQVKGLFLRLLTYLMRENFAENNKPIVSNMELLKRIKDYLHYHSNREVTLDELVREFNISKFYLTRLFKKAFNMTPIQCHQLIRIEKVKEMIQFTDISLNRIAEKFGFTSINAFSRVFKNVEGVPPSFYRKRG